MKCVTKKVGFSSPEEASKALVQARAKYSHGPVNFYYCTYCGSYHLTSKGKANEILSSEETKSKINKEAQASYWEDKLKRK